MSTLDENQPVALTVNCQDDMEFCVMANRENSKLTQREREVIALVAWGLTNQEISEALKLVKSIMAFLIHLYKQYIYPNTLAIP